MSLSIENVREATAEEWDELWHACDSATYFQSREWAEIWALYTDHRIRPAPRHVLFSDGTVAVLPLSMESLSRGLAIRYLLSPAGTFGGWLGKDGLNADHASLLASYVLANFKSLVWRLNPYDTNMPRVLTKGRIEDDTQVLKLSEGFDLIHKRWTKGHSSAARKARKAGITVASKTSLQTFQDYFEIYKDSMQRWGDKTTTRYNWALFEIIADRKSPYVQLWLAYFEGIPVAGALCFYSHRHAVYWHGSALQKYFKLRPVNLLLYEAIKDACERGCAWFDFNPSGGIEGVRAFKRSFGTENRSCPVVVRRDWRLSALNLLKGSIVGRPGG